MNVSPLIKAALTPGSIAFLVLCLLIWSGLRFGWPRNRRMARGWLIGVIALYVTLALPIVATTIVGGLPPVVPADLDAWSGGRTVIVLDGDNRRGRVSETLRVYRAASPQSIIVLGEPWIADALVAEGIPRPVVMTEPGPGTTRGQVGWVGRRLLTRPAEQVVLIASRLQMPRIAALVQAEGLTLGLRPAPIDREPPTTGAWQFVPTYVALRASRDAIYEHAALAFYGRQGWIHR